jgi:uncharacterized membrane protein
MNAAFRIVLAGIGILAGLLSLLSLLWWSVHSYGVLTGHDAVEVMRQNMPNVLAQASEQQIFFVKAREYFAAIGGFIGWASLVALCTFANREIKAVPKWVVVGCAIGMAAAISLPGGGVYAYPPIAMAVALLLRCYLVKPNHTVERDARKSGARPSP